MAVTIQFPNDDQKSILQSPTETHGFILRPAYQWCSPQRMVIHTKWLGRASMLNASPAGALPLTRGLIHRPRFKPICLVWKLVWLILFFTFESLFSLSRAAFLSGLLAGTTELFIGWAPRSGFDSVLFNTSNKVTCSGAGFSGMFGWTPSIASQWAENEKCPVGKVTGFYTWAHTDLCLKSHKSQLNASLVYSTQKTCQAHQIQDAAMSSAVLSPGNGWRWEPGVKLDYQCPENRRSFIKYHTFYGSVVRNSGKWIVY